MLYFFFNLIPKLKTISFEQDVKWSQLLFNLSNKYKLKTSNIILLDVKEHKEGGMFDISQIKNFKKVIECDLLYIDGPYLILNREVNTFTKKSCYYDFEYVLNSNLPKVIMIEGRTSTVDAIKNSEYSKFYDFYPEFDFSIERKNFINAFNLRRHSLFIKKTSV